MSQENSATEKDVCDLLGVANETKVVIQGFECLALLDTGSMISSISEKFYRDHLQDTHPLQEISNVSVEGANGTPLSLLGVVEVDMTFPDSKLTPLQVPLIVMPVTNYNQNIPAIIGTNVLSRIKDVSAVSGNLRETVAFVGSTQHSMKEDVSLFSVNPINYHHTK